MQIKFETKVDRSETIAERASNFQRGDVIEIYADDHVWADADFAPGTQRILSLPNLSEHEAKFWVASETPHQVPPPAPEMLQRRQQRLNLRAMPVELRAWLDDDNRADPVKTLDWTGNDLMAYGYRVQPLVVE